MYTCTCNFIAQQYSPSDKVELPLEGLPACTTTVIGIATVELGGSPTTRPTYYFDCITNLNNGSGIRWDRTYLWIEQVP